MIANSQSRKSDCELEIDGGRHKVIEKRKRNEMEKCEKEMEPLSPQETKSRRLVGPADCELGKAFDISGEGERIEGIHWSELYELGGVG